MFPTERQATLSRDYIQGMAQQLPAAGEYSYVAGSILLRVSRELTPTQAGEYEAAFKKITG